LGLREFLTKKRALCRRREPDAEAVRRLVESASFVLRDVVIVRDAVSDGRSVVLRGVAVAPDDSWKHEAVARVSRLGHRAFVKGDANELAVYIPLRVNREGERVWVNAALFLVTVISTLFAWTYWFTPYDPLSDPYSLVHGVPFAATLLSILLVHEFGHYLAARRQGVAMSLPYFIPMPIGIGTMGAIIKGRSPIRDRTALLDIGAWGPIPGFIVAVAAVIVGTLSAEVAPAQPEAWLRFGDSLTTWLVTRVVLGPVPPGMDIFVGPVYIAGWIGLLITAMNLMPAGQLDGGHIARALLGGKSAYVAHAVRLALLGMGLLWTGWFVWVVFITLIGVVHPPVADESTPLSIRRKIVGWAALGIFVLTFMPVPFPV
jgi:membrane-associated protease RseP (regulator of RpoE activity)